MGTGFRTSGLVCLSILKVSRTSKLAIFSALNQKNTIPRVLNWIAIEMTWKIKNDIKLPFSAALT
jgi:hypothetical protein